MKKTDLLFQMLEHPEQYSEAQWRDILADDECRELYVLMSKTKSASEPPEISDDEIAAEWQRLSRSRAAVIPLWRKIAAAAAIVIALCGITYAAVHTGFFGLHEQKTPQNEAQKPEATAPRPVQATAVETANDSMPVVAEPQLYDNVPLEQILSELSAYYHVDVEYRSQEVRSLRLYYQWEPDYPLDKVVEMLSHFESLSIHREGDKLVVESSQEGKQ